MRKILLAAAAAVIALALFGCKQAQAHKHTYIWHCDANGHSQICACGALFEKAASHTDAGQKAQAGAQHKLKGKGLYHKYRKPPHKIKIPSPR